MACRTLLQQPFPTNYKVFITMRPFEVEHLPDQKRMKLAQADRTAASQLLLEYLIPKHEQKELVTEATGKLLGDLQSRILEADNWQGGRGPSRDVTSAKGIETASKPSIR